MKFTLICFEAVSGLSINWAKTCLVGVNLPEEVVGAWADLLGCKAGSFPITFLGMPLHFRKTSYSDWVPVIDRIQGRLAGWKAKTLSRGGRLTLVNSVLTAMPVYFLSSFRVPDGVRRKIDTLRRRFLWKGGGE